MEQTEALKKLLQIKIDDKHRKNDFTVSFCGVFSSGKSSILNYLLDCADFKLPVGNFPITKVITRIKYGKTLKFYCSIVRANNLQVITKDKFEKMVLGKVPLPSGCTEILIEVPSKILENGVVFIDTPGFLDEMGGELEKKSHEAVLRSDMAIFCTSAASLGHQFERDFIIDLDECIGNYCMVVNRMDCCNTKEDEEDIEKKATFLMKGKGGIYLNNLFGRTYFFTIADGPYKNLGGFDSYLSYALIDMELRANLKKTSSMKIKKYRVGKIKDDIDLEIMGLKEELHEIFSEHYAKLNTIKQENNLRKAENTGKQRVFREKYYAKIDTVTSQIGTKVSSLSADEFSKNVHSELSDKYTKVFAEAERELSNIPHSDSRAYRGILSGFVVPEPLMEIKRKLGLLERLGEAISDLLNYGMLIDDGWVYGYNDYNSVALRKIKQELKPKLEKEIDFMANSASFIELLPEYTGFEERMNELKKQIESWRKIYRRCVVEE